jgi:cytochrome c oxidase cbb3-type subunit 3
MAHGPLREGYIIEGYIMIRKQCLIAALFAGPIIAALAYAQGTPTPVPDPVPIAPGKGVRNNGFTQYTRPLASQDVLIRGKGLYTSSCASCHSSDIRGVPGKGINLLRSGIVLSDKAGELIADSVAKHNPKINLVEADNLAISEYLHSIEATMGGQGSPPGRNPMGIELNVLVGDAKAGEAYFAKACASCHSLTGDMQGIASKYADAKALQNGWFAGMLPGAGRGGGGRGGMQATVTMPNGTKYEGRSLRKDDYIVVLMLADGTRQSIPLDVTPAPKVEMKDPQEAHKKVAMAIDDPDNKNLHDITAFLWTLK